MITIHKHNTQVHSYQVFDQDISKIIILASYNELNTFHYEKILITILCLGIISCSVEDINTSSISTEMEQDFHYVSSDEAIIIANSFVQENGVIPVTKSEDLNIKNLYSINDSSNQPLLHVINYDRGGFAIVSADDSLQVCAHKDIYGNNAGNYKPVVGCVPLAIARVMRYNHKPNNYSWNLMSERPPITHQTSSFLKDIHYAVKEYAENNGYGFNYTIWGNLLDYVLGAGPSISFPIGDFLKNKYGYPAAITETYTFPQHWKIRRELIDYHLPCILSGLDSSLSGHAWVCDGYHYHYRPEFDNYGEFIGAWENSYLHFLWGQTINNYDGWYLHNDVSYEDMEFSNYMLLTHRISSIDYWMND